MANFSTQSKLYCTFSKNESLGKFNFHSQQKKKQRKVKERFSFEIIKRDVKCSTAFRKGRGNENIQRKYGQQLQ